MSTQFSMPQKANNTFSYMCGQILSALHWLTLLNTTTNIATALIWLLYTNYPCGWVWRTVNKRLATYISMWYELVPSWLTWCQQVISVVKLSDSKGFTYTHWTNFYWSWTLLIRSWASAYSYRARGVPPPGRARGGGMRHDNRSCDINHQNNAWAYIEYYLA